MSDVETPEFISQSIRLARVNHKCCECYQVITRGSKYECTSGKWDGRVHVYKTCMHCADLRVSAEKRNGIISFGELAVSISEEFTRAFGPREFAEKHGLSKEHVQVLFANFLRRNGGC